MIFFYHFSRILLLAAMIVVSSLSLCDAQKLLSRRMNVTANKQSVSEVLQSISEEGKFYFSYNTKVIPGDSIVTFSANQESLRTILDQLLKGDYQYKEMGEYIILQKAPAEKFNYVSGHIVDHETGKPIDYVSVYSKIFLASAISHEDGNFRLKLKEASFPFVLYFSKLGYADTSVVIESEKLANISIAMRPKAIDLDEVSVFNNGADRTWLARLFVSSKLRAHSRNIGKFFVSLPYQASLTPGLGTHGRMSGQVTNKFSLNLLGGYTAGVNGVEMAGAFNISKKDVKWVQVAGVFNIVSGKVDGVQLSGMHNHVVGSMQGIQISGAGNLVGENAEGIQIGGLVNSVKQDFRGLQMGGGINLVKRDVSGLQIGGLGNITKGNVKGLQVGVFNYAKTLEGVQIGVVNVADSSSGYSIGVFSFIKKGKGSIYLYANDIAPVNVGWKTGNNKLYSIINVGSEIRSQHKMLTFGFGLGKQVKFNKGIAAALELSSNTVYVGDWDKSENVSRLQTLLELRLGQSLSLSAGPSLSLLHEKQLESKSGFKSFPPRNYGSFEVGKAAFAWMGWQAGLTWNYNHRF